MSAFPAARYNYVLAAAEVKVILSVEFTHEFSKASFLKSLLKQVRV